MGDFFKLNPWKAFWLKRNPKFKKKNYTFANT